LPHVLLHKHPTRSLAFQSNYTTTLSPIFDQLIKLAYRFIGTLQNERTR
jgi:hypothetical protein